MLNGRKMDKYDWIFWLLVTIALLGALVLFCREMDKKSEACSYSDEERVWADFKKEIIDLIEEYKLPQDGDEEHVNAWRDFEWDRCYCGNKLKATSSWRLKDGFYFVCSKCGRIYAWGWANSEKENK